MGGGSTETQSSTQSVNQVQLPPWVNQAAQKNYALAEQVSQQPYQQFQGQQVADIGPQTQQAWNLAASAGNAGADQYNAAQAGYLTAMNTPYYNVTAPTTSLNQITATSKLPTVTAQQVAGMQGGALPTVTAQQVAAGQLANTDLGVYENPYTQDVINKTLPLLQQQLGVQEAQLGGNATMNKAFGGSRYGVQQGVTAAQGALGMGQMAAQLNAQNFQQAQAAAEQDIQGRMQAALANQGANLTAQQANLGGAEFRNQNLLQAAMANQGAGLQAQQANLGGAEWLGQQNMQAQLANQAGQEYIGSQQMQAALANQQASQANINSMIQAAGGMGGLGNQAQQNQRQQFLELSTAGAQEQAQAQNQINAQMNAFNQMRAYPGQQLGVLQSALGMTPYGSTTIGSSSTQQEQQTNPSLMADITGGLNALGGAFGAGGPLNPLLSAMTNSDRHLKTDIEPVGTHQPSGLPMFSYRYKGDSKSYPKVVGPMAEDVMKVAPQAVKTVGVHPSGQAIHQVDMNALNATPSLTSVPSIRPQRMPGGNGSFVTRMPGALSPRAPQGAVGAMGASMRPPKVRMNASMPRVKGAMGAGRG